MYGSSHRGLCESDGKEFTGECGLTYTLLRGIESRQPLGKSAQRLKQLEIELAHTPALPLQDMYSQESKSAGHRDTCTSTLLTPALFMTVRLWNQPRCPSTDEWPKKVRYVYKAEVLNAIKKNKQQGSGGGLHL